MSKIAVILSMVLGFASMAQAILLTNHKVVRCVEFQRQVDPHDDASVIVLDMGDCMHSKFDMQFLNSRVIAGLKFVLKSQSITRQTLYKDLVSKHKFDLPKMRLLQNWVANSLVTEDKCAPFFYGQFPELVMQHMQNPETVKHAKGYLNAYEITMQFAQGMTCKRIPK